MSKKNFKVYNRDRDYHIELYTATQKSACPKCSEKKDVTRKISYDGGEGMFFVYEKCNVCETIMTKVLVQACSKY